MRSTRRAAAFTLLEVVVATGALALVLAVLLPGLTHARRAAHATLCAARLAELLRANALYAEDHTDRFGPGAADFARNLHRWHGARDKFSEPFDGRRGALAAYLAPDPRMRQCPAFLVEPSMQTLAAFERGAGGYGYNGIYIGADTLPQTNGAVVILDDRIGARRSAVRRPGETLMFADAAFATPGLIEYSFAEPRFQPVNPTRRADPSLHFRHARHVNVGWTDGHVDRRLRTYTWSSGFYGGVNDRFDIGWFGENDDNGYFDLR